jgi:aminopeptidase N
VIQETNIDLSVDPNGQAMSVRTRLHVADNTGDQQLVCHFLKGALAIHALQTQMGDERFFPGFKMLFLQSGDEPVTLAYYQQCFESAYGGSLATFFHRWYYEPGLPSITPPTAPTRR